MSYEDYTVNDFITDMYFQKWVTSSDELMDRFWQTWIIQHPGKADTIREARLMVDLLTFREISMGEEEARAVVESTKSQIKFGKQIIVRSTPFLFRKEYGNHREPGGAIKLRL